MIFSPEELVRFRRERVYPAAGISGDPEREIGIGAALRVLRSVPSNAALLLHEEGWVPGGRRRLPETVWSVDQSGSSTAAAFYRRSPLARVHLHLRRRIRADLLLVEPRSGLGAEEQVPYAPHRPGLPVADRGLDEARRRSTSCLIGLDQAKHGTNWYKRWRRSHHGKDGTRLRS
jgi:hypothetical protein